MTEDENQKELLRMARNAEKEPDRNYCGYYSCNCGGLIGELADEIERLQAVVNLLMKIR